MGILEETQMQPSPHPQSKERSVECDLCSKAHFYFPIQSYPPVICLEFFFSPPTNTLACVKQHF